MSVDIGPPALIVILGPTAVGKTALSLSLGKRYQGEIISADSRLYYRGMDIGTAKPTIEEQSLVPHHLIDIANPDERWSLGKFKREAIKCIEGIHKRGHIPFLVGGTGQFIRAITQGWVVPELKADDRLRKTLYLWAEREIGAQGLHQRLMDIDPEAAKNILPGNLRRTVRAFEVIFNTGRRFSDLRQKEPVPYRILQIGLIRPREEMDRQIEERVDAMMEQGFLDEVRTLLTQGYSRELPSMTALGYRQLSSYLEGEMSIEDAVMDIKRVTKKFYRRQMTWFKRSDKNINWFEVSESLEKDVVRLIENFLSG